MTRIPTLTLETMSEEQRRIYRGIMSRRGPVQGPLLAAINQELCETAGRGGTFVTIFPEQVAVKAAKWPMNCSAAWPPGCSSACGRRRVSRTLSGPAA